MHENVPLRTGKAAGFLDPCRGEACPDDQGRHTLAQGWGHRVAALIAFGVTLGGCSNTTEVGPPSGKLEHWGQVVAEESGDDAPVSGDPQSGTGGSSAGDEGLGGEGGHHISASEIKVRDWLAARGDRCEASDVRAEPTQTVPTPGCLLFEPRFPGVFAYEAAEPGTANFDWGDNEWPYAGCDDAGSACVGRMEYDWSVEYEKENQWILTFTPKRSDCDYEHVILADNPYGDGVAPRTVISWAPATVRIFLQPTPSGYKIGSIQHVDGSQLDWWDFTTYSTYLGGVPEAGISAALQGVLIEHLESLEWACDRP